VKIAVKLKDYQGEVRMIALYILEEDKYICHITNDEKNIEQRFSQIL